MFLYIWRGPFCTYDTTDHSNLHQKPWSGGQNVHIPGEGPRDTERDPMEVQATVWWVRILIRQVLGPEFKSSIAIGSWGAGK